MPLTQDAFNAASLAVSRDQAAAAWAAARAAQWQAWTTPIAFLVALIAAVAGPFVTERMQLGRLRQTAANLSLAATGTIGLPLAMLEDTSLHGKEIDEDYAFFDQIEAALARYPHEQLGDAKVMTALIMLGHQVHGARVAYLAAIQNLARGVPPVDLVEAARSSQSDALRLNKVVEVATKRSGIPSGEWPEPVLVK